MSELKLRAENDPKLSQILAVFLSEWRRLITFFVWCLTLTPPCFLQRGNETQAHQGLCFVLMMTFKCHFFPLQLSISDPRTETKFPLLTNKPTIRTPMLMSTFKSSVGGATFPKWTFFSPTFVLPFLVSNSFFLFICELCCFQAWWFKKLLRVKVSGVTLILYYPWTTPHPANKVCSALVRGIIQGESSMK